MNNPGKIQLRLELIWIVSTWRTRGSIVCYWNFQWILCYDELQYPIPNTQCFHPQRIQLIYLSLCLSIYSIVKGYRRSMPPQCVISSELAGNKYFHTWKFKKFFHVEFIVDLGRYLLEGREIQSQHFQQVGWKQLSQHSQQSQMTPPHLIYIIYHLDPGFLLVFETV